MSTQTFETIHIEGGLLSVEYLHTIARAKAEAQENQDYHTPAGITLQEEVARAWKIARALRLKKQENNLAGGKFAPEFLRQVLGFNDITAYKGEGETSPIHTAHGGKVPIVIAPKDEGLDKRQGVLQEAREMTPFNLAQTHLNQNEYSQWGIVCDDNNLRILRDSTSMTRAAYIDADLYRMLEEGEGHYSDFKALYLVAHTSRFAPTQDCPLEKWRQESVQTGIRAHDKMRGGVTNALLALGNGFLHHPKNSELKKQVAESGGMQAYYRELLWMVYRLIFLFVTEDRGILQRSDATQPQKDVYRHGYGVSRLRDRAMRPVATDDYDDLWEGAKYTFFIMQGGEKEDKYFSLPKLGGLFSRDRCEMLYDCRLRNGDLLKAIQALSYVKGDDKRRTRINYRDMGANELGSIYESLLELTPYCDIRDNFCFYQLTAEENRGNARKISGSYYTPSSLVEELVKNTLSPVLDRVHSEKELLEMRVLDPACGSGHFLLAAANHMADKLIHLRGGEGGVGEVARRRYMRDIVKECIFGVDKNGMALDLARTALWLETFDAEKPLLMLDNRLQRGDSLLGVRDFELLRHGIPDAAYKAFAGDDADLCRRLKRTNREERRNNTGSLFAETEQDIANEAEIVDALPEDDLQQVAEKRIAYGQIVKKQTETGANVAADMFSAAFLMVKREEQRPPTTIDLFTALEGKVALDNKVTAEARACAKKNRVFHWFAAFRHIAKKGGFDVILANPPWETLTLREKEFFARRSPKIAQASTQARRKMIAALAEAEKGTIERRLWKELQQAKHAAKSTSNYAHNSGNYPLTGIGDVNTYALFAELCFRLRKENGVVGIIVPTGIATDVITKDYFSHLVEGKHLKSLYDFENRRGLFPDVHRSFRFVLMTLSTSEGFDSFTFAHAVAELHDKRRYISLNSENLRLVNPNTCTAPLYRTPMDCTICEKIYHAASGIFWRDEGNINPWKITFQSMFHMSGDSRHFRRNAGEGYVRLYESKYFHQYDHRWATSESDAPLSAQPRTLEEAEKQDPAYAVSPRYYVKEAVMREHLADAGKASEWLLARRRITNATSERTLIVSVLPLCAVGDNAIILHSQRSSDEMLLLLAISNSIVIDYAARQKIANVVLTQSDSKQLPILPPESFTQEDKDAIVPMVLELSYTAHDLKPFYDDIVRQNPHYDSRPAEQHGQPFPWNEERRARLRALIDARIALKYGISRDELRYILDPKEVMGEDYPSETFRVLQEEEEDENKYGEYRTRRLVLEAYDELAP